MGNDLASKSKEPNQLKPYKSISHGSVIWPYDIAPTQDAWENDWGQTCDHPMISKVLRKQIPITINVLFGGFLGIVILGDLETHNAIVEMYDVFSQDKFPIYSYPEIILQWKTFYLIIRRAI